MNIYIKALPGTKVMLDGKEMVINAIELEDNGNPIYNMENDSSYYNDYEFELMENKYVDKYEKQFFSKIEELNKENEECFGFDKYSSAYEKSNFNFGNSKGSFDMILTKNELNLISYYQEKSNELIKEDEKILNYI